MKIWKLDFEVDKYDNLLPVKKWSLEEICSFDGRSKINSWVPIRVEKMENKKLSNAPGFDSHIPVFDKTALDGLMDLMESNVEILPLKMDNIEFYAINIITVLDCINYEKSVYKTFDDGEKILRFIKYEFIKEMVNDNNIFKIKDEALKDPFVSDKFKTRVEEKKLKGFKFKLAWTDED